VAVNERVPRHQLLVGLAAGGALLLSGCASASSQEPVVPTPEVDANADALAEMLDPCAKPNLTTVEPGAITFATSSVPAPPFFLTDDPSDREGFEADFAYSVAEVLGFRPGQVTWEFVPSEQVLSGEFVDYDLALGGFVAAGTEGSPVVFSQPYVVVDVDVLPDPRAEPSPNEDDEQSSGQQNSSADAVELSFALVSGNPLLACTDRALDEMSEDGTLNELRARWLDPQ
jgi:ABC-type amino acid transport substrate-binding protein